ncbi:uncharacterized protein LOC107370825 [Tetranychus urticae]|uniref:BACK domain-containing protein n=1 Tax=Tetranychus urticae TaxID=32264 RepID=T1JY78_TETUR|nr:uncharacterized protein LOC107370825 [Tetranychus urticae]
MDSRGTDYQLTIVNRSVEHRIGKRLIREIPYFEKIHHDLKGSKENKIELDFDEQTLVSFLNWIELGYIFMEMKNIMHMCNIADYFVLKSVINNIEIYFHNNFKIEHLPIVLPQVTTTSKLINSGALNAFLCRHFSKIANTTVWLDYPVEIIKYICNLEVMVHSEIQVFEAIYRWMKHNPESRKCYLDGLLNHVRWCHLEAKDLALIEENEFFKSSGFKPIICPSRKLNCDCGLNRTDRNYFIMIEKLGDSVLRIKVLDNNLLPLFNRIMKPDASLPSHILPDQHISDISFHFGNQIIRVDWNRNKYKYLSAQHDSYFQRIFKYIFEKDGHHIENYCDWNRFLEANERCILINFCSQLARYWPKHTAEDTEIFSDKNHAILATVLNNNIYLLTKKLEFIQSDIYFQKHVTLYKYSNRPKTGSIDYSDHFILTSKQSNDDRVILIDTHTKDARCFNVSTREWSSINHIIYPDSNEQQESCSLLTFTSAFISMDIIRLFASLKV